MFFRRPFCIGGLFFFLLTRVHQRSQDGRAQCAEDDGQGNGNRDMYPVHNQHLDTDKAQHESQAVFEENKAFGKVCQQKVHGTKTQNSKNVGSEDDERVGGYGKNSGNAVHGEDNVAPLNSIIINTSKSGVAMRLPFSMVKNFSPSNCWLVGMTFLSRVRILFWDCLLYTSPSPRD